jgi:hypothetical protein
MAPADIQGRYHFATTPSQRGTTMLVENWPSQGGSPILVRKYEGESGEAMADAFHADAVDLASQGYYPAGQHYIAGSWGCGPTLLALVLCLFVIGFPIVGFMLLNPPIGSLFVTFVYRTD